MHAGLKAKNAVPREGKICRQAGRKNLPSGQDAKFAGRENEYLKIAHRLMRSFIIRGSGSRQTNEYDF